MNKCADLNDLGGFYTQEKRSQTNYSKSIPPLAIHDEVNEMAESEKENCTHTEDGL